MEDLEKDYGDDVEFLFAKLKLAQDKKDVSVMCNGPTMLANVDYIMY